jgi:exosortase family protein XrtF
MLKRLKESPIKRFLFTAGILYTGWLLLYHLVIQKYTTWDYLLNSNIVYISQQFFGLFSLATSVIKESDHVVLLLDTGNFTGVWVGDECNGFKLFSIFSIFIMAFPGNIKTKLWFIPLGLVIIHLANVFRVMALVLINNHYPQYLDFNHLYTFTILVYAIIFILWYIWAKKYAPNAKQD